MNNSNIHLTSPLWPTGIFLLCAFLIALACYATFENINANEIIDTNRTLVSVGQLKTRQIESYLSERTGDASVVSRFSTSPLAQYWLTHRRMNPPVILYQLMESIGTAYQYRALLLLDAEANIRLNTGKNGVLTEAGKAIALRAMRERSPASFKIYFGDPSTPDEPVLDTFVPVMSPDGTTAVGMIVMRSELKFLFQLLQSWPTESETAESLLVTKDGTDVLFLNELRHRKDTAAKFSVPMSSDPNSFAWPAMLAVNGHFGLIEANDYRGKRILGYTLAVPGTPWSMVVKMDLEEAVARSQRLLRVALVIAAMLTAFTGIIVWLWWRKEVADHLANKQLRESESRYRLLVESSPYCIHEIDLEGRMQSMNRAGLSMLGIDDARRIYGIPYIGAVSQQDAGHVGALLRDAINNGTPSYFEFRAAGEKPQYFKSCFIPIKDTDGKLLKLMGITEDITERKRVEQELNWFFSLVPDLVCIASADGRFLKINSVWQETLGYTEQEILATPSMDLIHPDDRESTMREVARQLAGERILQFVNRYRCKDGSYRWLEWRASPAVDKKLIFGSARDITERREAEQRMRELTAYLQTVREEEKASIAREIHDDLGGTLTALKMETYWLAEELSAGRESASLLKHIELISKLGGDAVNVTRRLITGLRPTILDDLGLLAAIEWQADQFSKHSGIRCRVNGIEDNPKLDKQYSIAMFRIFQEALTNVARHSGASRVDVDYHCCDDEVMLSVSDNGRGLPEGHTVAPTSYGLRGMHERVEQFGGKIEIKTPPGGGFNVTVTLPLHVERRKEARA